MLTDIEFDARRRILTAFLHGEIDHHTAHYMRDKIDISVQKCSPDILALDFSGVTFMDSSGIGLIMGRYKLINGMGGDIVVLNPPPDIKRLIELAGLERITRVEYTKHPALCKKGVSK